MKKLILFWTLFVLSTFVNAQDVIDLSKLANKSTANYTISGNSVDFKNIDHEGTYTVRFIGELPNRLLLKNSNDCTIDMRESKINSPGSENKTLQLADCKDSKVLLGNVVSNAASTGTCGQSVFLYGKWKDMEIIGGNLHQNGSKGGAAFQTESYSDPNYSHGTLIVDGLTVTQAMGEGMYIGLNQPTKAYLDTLIIRNTNISNTRRDFWQEGNVRYTLIENNRGSNGGLEKNTDHVSGFSLNGKNTKVIIRNNIVDRVPQFIYSSTASNIEAYGNTYTQGDAMPVNQAIYTKSPMTLTNNVITTPAAKEAVITADGAVVSWNVSNSFTGPKMFRYFTGGSSAEFPYVQTKTEELTVEVEKTSTYEKVFVIYNGQKIQIK